MAEGRHEGPEGRLAKMDAGRKDRRPVHRGGGQLRGPGPAPSRPRVVSGHRSTFDRSPHIVVEDADMRIVIGPILRRGDGYGFDTWTAGKGVSTGYPYRRIEHANYARNAEINAPARRRAPAAVLCHTLDQFTRQSTGHEM